MTKDWTEKQVMWIIKIMVTAIGIVLFIDVLYANGWLKL